MTWDLVTWAAVRLQGGGCSVVVDFLFIVTPIAGVCDCSVFCCTLLYVHSSIAIILMGKRELVALLNLSSWCLVMVEWLFLAVPLGCLRFVIVVFPDHTHLLFLYYKGETNDLFPQKTKKLVCPGKEIAMPIVLFGDAAYPLKPGCLNLTPIVLI